MYVFVNLYGCCVVAKHILYHNNNNNNNTNNVNKINIHLLLNLNSISLQLRFSGHMGPREPQNAYIIGMLFLLLFSCCCI